MVNCVIRNEGSLLTVICVNMTRGFQSEFRERQALAQPEVELPNP